MIRVLAASALFLLSFSTLRGETLSNNDVVRMVAAGLPKNIIVQKIRTSEPAFDVSAHALIQLHTQKVPETVLLQMIQQAHEAAQRARHAARSDAHKK